MKITQTVAFAILLFLGPAVLGAADALPGTEPVDWPEADLSGRMMDGAHRFVEQRIAVAGSERAKFWPHDGGAAEERALAENRQQLTEILGAVDARSGPRMERFGDDRSPAVVAETARYKVYQVRWAVLDGLEAEGLLVEPSEPPLARLVFLTDANQTPEQFLGLSPGLAPERQTARWLAENRCEMLLPVLVERRPLPTDDPAIRKSDQTSREWLYRQAYHMGRHLIGYEVQKIAAAVDWYRAQGGVRAPIGVLGYGEGGLLAFYAAAIDPRIDAALVSGYFGPRERVWEEPIDRNVWGLLKRFGDAEIASLILPRHLLVEHAAVEAFASSKGSLQTPAGKTVRSEFGRVRGPATSAKPALFLAEDDSPVGPFSPGAVREFASRLGISQLAPVSAAAPPDRRSGFDGQERQQRTVRGIEQHVQGLLLAADRKRDDRFLYKILPELAQIPWNTDQKRPVLPTERFVEGAKAFRAEFRTNAMGQFELPYLPLHPRTRKILETPAWTAWDVVLDVWPDVFAWGVLVLPKDLKAGERRPVVVCQHGRNGVPRDTIDQHSAAYNDFAAKLAEQGFITFAPHNLYRGEDRYRWLCRKANNVRGTLFSFIIGQHEQILAWLSALPFVDDTRIAFYGLSYGGETAMRAPSVLEKYCLSICSGDFNQWTRKVASASEPFSFMRTIEWEMPYWNLGQTFDYAEMAYLMVPRPFMVERGHHDMVGRDPWVAHEYGKVQFLYAQLGLEDRTAIEYFQGGHSINGSGTFEFLHKQLRWP